MCIVDSLLLLLCSLIVVFGYADGSVGAAIVAVILVHVVIALYVYVAWKEGSTKTD